MNNRKAKLARAAAKDARVASGGEKQGGGSGTDPVSDTPESPDEFFDQAPSGSGGQGSQHNRNLEAQYIMHTDGESGVGVGVSGTGTWAGNNLDHDEQQQQQQNPR